MHNNSESSLGLWGCSAGHCGSAECSFSWTGTVSTSNGSWPTSEKLVRCAGVWSCHWLLLEMHRKRMGDGMSSVSGPAINHLYKSWLFEWWQSLCSQSQFEGPEWVLTAEIKATATHLNLRVHFAITNHLGLFYTPLYRHRHFQFTK